MKAMFNRRKFNTGFYIVLLMLLSLVLAIELQIFKTAVEPVEAEGETTGSLSIAWRDGTSDLKIIEGSADAKSGEASNPLLAGASLTFTFGNTQPAAPGELAISIPMYIYETRDSDGNNPIGDFQPPVDMPSREQYEANQTAGTTAFFYEYSDMDQDGFYDTVLFTNFREVQGAEFVKIEFNYGNNSTSDDMLKIKSGYTNNQITARAAYTPADSEAPVLEIISEPITIQVNTQVVQPTIKKEIGTTSLYTDRYQKWQDSWPVLKPTDADDYVYAKVKIKDYNFNLLGSQPYIGVIEEFPSNDGLVVFWQYNGDEVVKSWQDATVGNYLAGSKANSLNIVTSKMKQYYTATDYDVVTSSVSYEFFYCYVAYPKSSLNDQSGVDDYSGEVKNTVKLTNIGIDEESKTVENTIDIKFSSQLDAKYDYPGNYFFAEKKNYSAESVNASANGLNFLARGETLEKAVNWQLRNTARYYSKYNDSEMKRFTLLDDYMLLNNELLEEGDYGFNTLTVSNNDVYEEDFSSSNWKDKEISGVSSMLDVYGKVNNEWQKLGSIESGSLNLRENLTADEVITAIKVVVEDPQNSIRVWVDATTDIYGTENVRRIIEKTTSGTTSTSLRLVNVFAQKAEDEEGNVLKASNTVGKVENVPTNISAQIAKEDLEQFNSELVRSSAYHNLGFTGDPTYNEKLYKSAEVGSVQDLSYVPVTYKLMNSRTSNREYIAYLPDEEQKNWLEKSVQHETTFYDLLPEGYTLDTSTIKLYQALRDTTNTIADTTKPVKNFSYDLIYNWENTGRNMLIVEVYEVVESYFAGLGTSNFYNSIYVEFNGYYDLVDNHVYGKNRTNISIATSKELVEKQAWLTGQKTDTGEEFKSYGFDSVLKDINRDGNITHKITYAINDITLGEPVSAQDGVYKSTAGTEDVRYTESGMTVGGSIYSYRLRFSSSTKLDETTTGVILYDVLESDTSTTGAGADNPWQGKLIDIDVSGAQKFGIDPIIYYSTKLEINPYKQSESSLPEDADVTNNTIWSTVPPDDMGKVTAVAIDLSYTDAAGKNKFIWPSGIVVNILIYMQAPTEISEQQSSAYNRAGAGVAKKDEPMLFEQGNIAKVELVEPQVEIHKESDPESGTETAPTVVGMEDELNYILSIDHVGKSSYTNVIAEDTIPEGVKIDTENILVTSTNDLEDAIPVSEDKNVTLEQGGQKLQITIKELKANQTYRFLIPTIVDLEEGVLTNIAYLTEANGVALSKESETTWHKAVKRLTYEVEKKWEDAVGNQINPQEDQIVSVTVGLSKVDEAGEQETVEDLKLTREMGWQGEFAKVPEEDEAGETIKYKVTELAVEWASSIPEDERIDFTQKMSEPETAENGNQKVVLTNLAAGRIKIEKFDDNDEPVEGVSFKVQTATVSGSIWQVSEEKGAYETTLTTDNEGCLAFTELPAGNYLITEVKTVSGLQLLKEPIQVVLPFEADSDEEISSTGIAWEGVGSDSKYYYNLTYKIRNSRVFSLPDAGKRPNTPHLILGLVILFLGQAALVYVWRKERKNKLGKKPD